MAQRGYRKFGMLAEDSGGTYHVVKTDSAGNLKSNIVKGEVIATLGTLSVVKSGTLDQPEERLNGAVGYLGRPIEYPI